MIYKRIVLAGGNGYLGSVLQDYYRTKAEEIVVLSRNRAADYGNVKTIMWDAQTEGAWSNCLSGADMVVNLCGKNVNCRYTPGNRAAILDSRVTPTRLLGAAIEKATIPPRLWVNVTSATIYRHAEDRPQNEESGETGYGFSVDVCKEWEHAFFGSETPQTRKAVLRMGIVLGASDGVFPRLLNLVKTGLGGMQGNGGQYVSWIHEQDAARCTEWLLQNTQSSGVFNCTAPEPVQNRDMMVMIRQAYGIKFGLPTPPWLLEIGAFFVGTETELLLKSRWVTPQRLLDQQFHFSYGNFAQAINDIIWHSKRPRSLP